MEPQTPSGLPSASSPATSSEPSFAARDLRVDGSSTPAPKEGWAVAANHGAWWWREAWRLFRASSWLWIGIVLAFIAMMLVLSLIPLLGHIASTLLYPVLGAGLLVGSRALDQSEPLRFSHLFACFDRRLGPLMIAGVLYIVGWFVIWLVAFAFCVAIFGFGSLTALMTVNPAQVDFSVLTDVGMAALVGLLFVLLFGAPWMMAYWFAPALIALRGDRPVAAMKASFAASWRNVPPLLIYSLIGFGLSIVATIPLMLGWIVLAPVFAVSVYTSYKDIFGASA